MYYNLSNAVANIKLGFKQKRLVVHCRSNKFIKRILSKLIEEGIIRGFSIDERNYNRLKIHLKFDENFVPIVENLKIVSSSGNRVYFKFEEVLKAHARGEFYIISTTQGLFTLNEIIYNRLNLGGEVVLQIFYF